MYSHLLQFETLNHTLTFPFKFLEQIEPQIRQIIKRIITLHPQQQRFEFTAQHYMMLTQSLIMYDDIFDSLR